MIWKKGRGRGLERRGQRRRFGNGAAQELLEVLFVGEKTRIRAGGMRHEHEI